MDLSAVIFVVLAVAWALYLIPKALQHHDEMASDRLEEGHSDRVRILSRRPRVSTEPVATEAPEEPVRTASAAPAAAAQPARRPTRAAAKRAARNRRRVLLVLLGTLVVVWTLTWFAYLPIWAPALPGALVVAFLVAARLSVRTTQARRRSPSLVEEGRQARLETARAEEGPAPLKAEEDPAPAMVEDAPARTREQFEAALADEGSLWDPLPLTLPTYVGKARARRTVRTIELTGINSSGHDETDTARAQEAHEAEVTAKAQAEAEQRRVAGA